MKSLLVILMFMFSFNAFSGTCTKAQAKEAVEWACEQVETKGKAALSDLKSFKYCGQNYVWVQDSPDVKMVLHPIKRKLNHKDYGGRNKKDLKGFVDKNGKAIFIEFDKVASASPDGGWTSYVWAKPGAETATPKVSFTKKCKGSLGWVVGSGIWE